MKNTTQTLLTTSLAFIGSLCLLPVAEGQQAAAEGVLFEEVIVTASRREERQLDVAASLSVVDTDATTSQGITDINAIADFVPNLTATDAGGPGLGNLIIRGIYVGGAPTVGTYIDDVPYGGVVGGFASNLALDASLYDLDRIEVVRGPQGTLFGASAVGGVVRYVTRKPSLDQTEGYLFADYSSTDEGSDNTLIRGRISVPLVDDTFAIAASGYSENNGGYTDNFVTGGEDTNDHEFIGGRLSANWAVSDRVDLVASVIRHEADYDGVGYETFDPTTGLPVFGELQNEITAPRELEFDLYSFTANVDVGFATLTSVTSDQTVTIDNTDDLTMQLGPLLPPGTFVGFRSGDDSNRFTQEFRLTSTTESGLEWIVGAYYTEQESDSFQRTEEIPADINLFNLNTRQEYTEVALFANVTFPITDKWDATIGTRFSDNENEIGQTFTGALSDPLLNDLNTATDDTVTTWLLNTRYKVRDDLNIYGRAASGYRPGGANLVLNIGGMTFGTPAFTPDDLWSYEAGVKGRTANGRLSYDIGVYYIDWSDAQIQFINALTGIAETGNAAGGITARGLEASLTGEFFENLFVTGTLALADTELDQDEPDLAGLAGETLPGNPESSASLAADYIWPVNSGFDLILGATWRYTGEYTSDFSQAPRGSFENPSYTQLDLRLGLGFERFDINFYATNVTDESDYQTVLPVLPNFAYGVVLRPPTFGLNVRFNY